MVPHPCRVLVRRVSENAHSPWAQFLPSAFVLPPLMRTKPHRISGRTKLTVPVELVWAMSRDSEGCREVQLALENASGDDERRLLVGDLRGHVWEALRCPHANYVLQKSIAMLPASDLQFIIDEIMEGKVVQAARHKYGCRIIQRVLGNCPQEQTADLISTLFDGFLSVARHAYGTHVMQQLLRVCTGAQRARLADLILLHIVELSLSPYGCWIAIGAFENDNLVDHKILAERLLSNTEQLQALAKKRHGQPMFDCMMRVLDKPESAKAHSIFLANASTSKEDSAAA